jgi:hypothetical protein
MTETHEAGLKVYGHCKDKEDLLVDRPNAL